MNKFYLLLLLTCSQLSQAQEFVPYQVFSATGKKVTDKQLISGLSKADVVLFGEFHDNSIVHWLQLKVVQELHKKHHIQLGAEMFERDNQSQISAYLNGDLNEKAFDSTVRFWPNYKTDYKPLLEFAKTQELPFTATNVPRKYASLVFKKGTVALEELPAQEKAFMAPLPFPFDPELPSYKKMLALLPDHSNHNFPKAQAIKDATMAYSIVENKSKDRLFIHFNGSYHSDYYEGIAWYIKHYSPNLKVVTITTVTQETLKNLKSENKLKADFIIVTDPEITKTY